MHFGPKKVVVLASYKTVKEALVGNAEQFGDRDIFPIFYDINQGHGTSIICTRATTTGEFVSILVYWVLIQESVQFRLCLW